MTNISYILLLCVQLAGMAADHSKHQCFRGTTKQNEVRVAKVLSGDVHEFGPNDSFLIDLALRKGQIDHFVTCL